MVGVRTSSARFLTIAASSARFLAAAASTSRFFAAIASSSRFFSAAASSSRFFAADILSASARLRDSASSARLKRQLDCVSSALAFVCFVVGLASDVP